ncbi:MAG: TRZ/ATZ family hydrolase [Ectothiorhodospiraceae bacterium AqS1]|nr:TRZ/ATZ family hydrolase [Ectothiorhodospiraceae bacterium AqS1]
METADLLIEARWIIPIEPENTVLDDHAIVVRNKKIEAILPQPEARSKYDAKRTIRLGSHHVLLPGFVNTHTHSAMSLLRGIADDLPLMDWLKEHVWPVEGKWVSENFVRDGTELAVLEMLRGGTTCFNDMYFYPGEAGRVADAAGLRCTLGMVVIEFPTAWAKDTKEYFQRGLEVHDEFRNHPRIHTALAPHAPYTVSDDSFRRISTLAEELDIQIHTHLHESEDEVIEGIAQYGMRPFERLDRLGLMSPRLITVHMTQLEEREMERLAECGAHVVHCAESNLKIACGIAPIKGLLEKGVNVAIGTDGAASNNDLDMIQELRSAALLAKGISGDPTAVPAYRALEMATLGGARAIAREHEIGSLAPGKAADIIAVDLGAAETRPVYNPISQVAYAASRRQVSHVWVEGKALLEEGEPSTLDEQAILEKADRWQRKIASS